MPHKSKLAFFLVGDHLGRVKRIFPSGETSILGYTDCASKDNPVVSIEPLRVSSTTYYDTIYDNSIEYLIGKQNGHVYFYDCLQDKISLVCCNYRANENVHKVLPLPNNKLMMIYDKRVDLVNYRYVVKNNTLVDHYCPQPIEKTGDTANGEEGEPAKKKRKKKKKKAAVKQEVNTESIDINRNNIDYGFIEMKKPVKSQVKCASIFCDKVAFGGIDCPLKIFDINTQTKIFEADPPEPDWLDIRPDVYVSGLDFLGGSEEKSSSPHMIATCSKSDSVVRVYDTRSKETNTKAVISVDMNQTAFNEHAEAPRFVSIAAGASSSGSNQSVVVGSNVGQMFAIDLRLGAKKIPKKKLQRKSYEHLGGFKGARGCSIKDVKIIVEDDGQKVVSCCLDRYLRIHNFTQSTLAMSSRNLEKEICITTKPTVCAPVYYEDI